MYKKIIFIIIILCIIISGFFLSNKYVFNNAEDKTTEQDIQTIAEQNLSIDEKVSPTILNHFGTFLYLIF